MAKSISPDKGKSVSWYFAEKLTGWQQELGTQLHEIVLEIYPEAKHGIKWAQPVYETKEGPFCFMKGAKKHLTFGFWRGIELDDPQGKLEGSGEKMRHLKIKSLQELDTALITGYLRQAVALNAEKGNPTQKD
ncbi:MAG TPA: DUF1801 domain-containing protein [Bacteroidetes bacterium]|nr:DUF1801 domain-containing protein [Bacteroidota bacterium]